MKTPKVSIIVPIYNVEKYLAQCVDSLRNQTLQDLEIILVDDESPDKCPQMCDEYARQDNRIKVVHKKNGGLGFARNSGLDVATGEYVAFCDSDDFVSPDMMEKLYTTAVKYGADEVRSGTIFYCDGQKSLRHDVRETTVFRGADEVKRFVFDLLGPRPREARDVKYMMSVWLALHSRRVIEEHHVRFTSERQTLSEDLVFDLDLFPWMDCVVYVPDCYYHYRMNPQSLTHSFSLEKYRNFAVFFDCVRERLDAHYPADEYRLHLLRLKFLYLRGAISGAASSAGNSQERRDFLSTILHDELWDDLFKEYPYHQLPLKKCLYFLVAKLKCPRLMLLADKERKRQDNSWGGGKN